MVSEAVKRTEISVPLPVEATVTAPLADRGQVIRQLGFGEGARTGLGQEELGVRGLAAQRHGHLDRGAGAARIGQEVEEDAVQARLDVGGKPERRLGEAQRDVGSGHRSEHLQLRRDRRTETPFGSHRQAQVADVRADVREDAAHLPADLDGLRAQLVVRQPLQPIDAEP